MKALVYGHSQSGGMGLDLEKALKKAGYSVTRVTKVGWNDAKLVQYLPELPAGPYDRVFLYVGGNSDAPTPTAIGQLVQAFDGKAVVILPPVNTERTKKGGAEATAALVAKNEGNRAALAGKVRVYTFSGGLSDFEPDQIHMRPGSAASKAAAQAIVGDLQAPAVKAGFDPVLFVGLGLIAAVALALWARRR